MNRTVASKTEASKTASSQAANGSDAALDQILRQHLNEPAEQLAPSSGFVISVMDSIHQQAAEPPPIAFPWRCVLPGAVAILCGVVAFVVFIAHNGRSAGPGIGADVILPTALSSGQIALCAVVVAIMASVAVVAASFRLAGRSR